VSPVTDSQTCADTLRNATNSKFCMRSSALLVVCSGTQKYFRMESGEVQQIRLRTEDRENGDLGAVAPSQGFRSICK
jgi:hypothetical protein